MIDDLKLYVKEDIKKQIGKTVKSIMNCRISGPSVSEQNWMTNNGTDFRWIFSYLWQNLSLNVSCLDIWASAGAACHLSIYLGLSNTVLTIDDNIKNTTSYAHGRISGWLPSPRPSGAPRGPGSLHANCFFGTLINCNLAREFAPSCLALWSFLGTSFSFILCKYNVYYKQNCALLHQNKTTIKIYSSSTGCSGLNRT